MPETAVGLADLVTGGRAGKAAEGIGFRPKEAKQILDDYLSPEQKAANQQVAQADGFVDKLGAIAENPSVIPHAVVESAAPMLAGGVVGRGIAAVAPKVSPLVAGAVGEGAVMAGGAAEQIRQQTDDGLLTGKQALAAAGTGLAGSTIGGLGAKVGQRLGLGDVDTALVNGTLGVSTRSMPARIAGGALAEGALEEMPQSAAEQVLQNYALDRELGEGVGGAAAMGLVTGGAMGAGFGAVSGRRQPAEGGQPESAQPVTDPDEPPPLVVSRGADAPDFIQPIPTAENPTPVPVERPDPSNGPLSAAASMLPPANPIPVLDIARIDQQLGQGEVLAGHQQEQQGAQAQQEQSAPSSPEEARIREAIANVEMRARLGGMNPVLAQERARLSGQLLTLQQAAEEAQRAKPAIGDQRSDFFASRNGFTSRSRDPWVNPANNRSSDPYDRFPGIDQVPPQPLEGELLTDAKAVPQQYREGSMTPVRDPLTGELLGGDLQAQSPRPGLARQGETLEGEVLSPRLQRALATTFKKRGAAELARNSLPAPERYAVEEQGGTFAIRQLPPKAPSIAGREIDGEWSEFAQESGTLAIPRAEMPQIKAEHRGAMVNFLNARGIQHEEQTVPAASLKPTQAEFSREKVAQAKGFSGGDRAILVSNDGHVLDGHHQWLARRDAGGDVRVIRLQAPIRDLLPAVAEFPSATQDAGAQPMDIGRQPKAPKRGQRRSLDRDRDSVVQAAIRLGGITTQWKQDTTGDTVGNKNIPGVGALWSDKTGTSLDDMASLLDQHGYVPAGEMEKDGGVSWLQEAIRDELSGRPRYAADSARQIEAAEQELLNRYAEAVARAIDEREAEYARIEAEYGPDAAADARSFDEAIAARSEHIEGAIEDAREQQEIVIDGELATEADATRRDDQLRQADGREGRAAGENTGEAFQLQQQTEAGLAEQDRQRQAREQAENEARREAEQKAQADAELNDFTLTGSDRPADVGAARGQNNLFGAQPAREQAEAPVAQQDPAADAPPPAQEVPAGEIGPEKPKRRSMSAAEKIDDTGDSLYWNRKNPWRGGGLKWEQIAGENEALRAKLVTKARVWAKPDWQAYLDELLPKLPEQQRDAAVLVARLTKQVYDALPAAPKDRTDKGLQAYIEVVERVRGAAEALLQDGERHVELLNGLTRRSGDILSFSRQAGTMPIFDAVFPEIAAGGRFQRGTLANDRGQVIGNKVIKAMQWSQADASKALKDIKAGWPASQEAWQKQGYRVLARDTLRAAGVEQLRGVYAAMIFDGRNHLTTLRDGEGARREFATQAEADAAAQAELQSWAPFLLLDKRNRLVSGFDSEELAIEAARASVKREAKPSVRETPLADAEIQRAGSERREAGQDVTADQLRETFGFRGVNFGKYVPQGERQSHLNRAFDAMHDLAEVLGVPPRAMSLNGMLGLAFGAQGNGGKFAAHFVPGVNEINLTRNAGAGSLAHEWAHALDHYFGVQGGMASKEKPYASHIGPRGAAGELRSEIRTAIANIGTAMRSMEEGEEQVRQRAATRVDEARRRQAAYLERNQVAEKVAGNAEAEAALARILAGEQSEYVELPSRKRNKDYVPGDVKTVADAIGFDAAQTVNMHDTVSSLGYSLKDQRENFQKRLVHTNFYKSSQVLDGKGKAYWSTPHEMFARSFEAFVLDRLMERGAQNDYLVSPVKRDQGVTDPDYPYPAGLERAAINRAFQTLVDAVEIREGVDGNVVLFSLDEAGSSYRMGVPAKGIPLLSARMIAAKFEKQGVKVKAVATPADLPPHIFVGIQRAGVERRVRGLYHQATSTSYIIASNLRSTNQAVSIVLHEAIGHGGIKQLLGDRLAPVMRDIFNDIPEAERLRLMRNYQAQVKAARMSSARAEQLIAEEYVAHLAETDPQNSLLDRLVAILRKWIRENFGDNIAVKWTRNDLVQLLAEARRQVVVGNREQSLNGGVQTAAAYSLEGDGFRAEVERTTRAPGQSDRLLAEAVANAIAAAPELAGIQVVQSFEDLPLAVRARAERDGVAPGNLRGVFRPDGQYLVADNLESLDEAVHTAVHEMVGHLGVRGVLGRELDATLERIYSSEASTDKGRQRIAQIREAYAAPLSRRSAARQRLMVAEEIIAHLAESGDRPGVLQRFVSKVRAVLRKLYPQVRWSYNDILGLIEQSRKWLQRERAASENQAGADNLYSLAAEPDTRDALRKLGLAGEGAVSMLDRIRNLTQADLQGVLGAWATRSREGLFDGLDGIRRAEEAVGVTDVDQQGYVSARMASGIADVMHGVLHYAAPEWREGVVAGKEGSRGVLEILGDLGPDNLTPWLAWLGGKRGQLLKAEGRENNLADADIAELIGMAAGKEALFERVYREYAQLNEAVLDLAEQAGLIDAEARAKWATDYYVPFYRQQEGDEGLFSAPRTKRGLSHQTAAIRALKGGKLPTNDLLGNMLAGWTKRIDAAMKNKALLEVVDNLKGSDYLADESPRYQQVLISRSQIAAQIRQDRKALRLAAQMLGLEEGANSLKVLNELMKPQNEGFEKLWTRVAPTDPDIIRVQRAGKNEYYRVNDESLLRGLKFMAGSTFNDPITKIGRAFKRILTTGVTASPDFILRNFIRDAAHAWMINKDGFVLGKDSIKGMRDALREDQDYRDLMFAGGSFQGGYVHGTDPEASAQIIRRALEKKGFTREQQEAYLGSLVNTPAKAAAMLKQGWQKYREVGDKVENANRLSTYKAALAAGKSKRQAAFEAKDLMDYSLRGNFAAAQWFTDVVPFLNARLQGLYKLGRAVKGDKSLLAREVAMKGAYIALFSLLLAGLNDDDERYQALQDWDKDMHWHIFLGQEHFRIPKPFELGLVFGTVPERLLHALTGSQDGEDLAKAVSHGVFQTLAFNPVPQFYQPIRELQANRNFFRDMPIEDMADEGKLPEARYDERTSTLSRALGQVTGPVAGLSPKQLDHLVMGYTGTLGGYVLSMSNLIAAGFSDAARPALIAGDIPVLKVLYQGDAVRSTQYQTEFYDMLQQAEQLHRTIRSYREEGKLEQAAMLLEANREKLRHRPALGLARKQLGNIRQKMDRVYRDTGMDAAAKRVRLDDLQRQANGVAERVTRLAGEDF
ncbi:LPD38 domain-containing protein [Geopseudomonas sagittaria]|uniref:LPD38 domain-containing protein n=1 Tax=Geopseudomonas sagittaria TaxID=1135990 RepID=UPI0011136E4E|nr:LPD38 domain-containing protein [Pseudomonas sagittaria]